MSDKSLQASSIVESIFQQNDEFTIIGLTGRVMSGQDDVVEILTNPKLSLLRYEAEKGGYKDDAQRENAVVYRFLKRNWHPFIRVHTSSIMMSFLLENCIENPDNVQTFKQTIVETFRKACDNVLREDYKSKDGTTLSIAIKKFCFALYSMHKDSNEYNKNDKRIGAVTGKVCEWMEEAKLESTEGFVGWWRNNYMPNSFTRKEYSFNKSLLPVCYVLYPLILQEFKEQLISLNNADYEYTAVMQTLGNHLRAYGNPFMPDETNPGEGLKGDCVFTLAKRSSEFIKILRYIPYGDIYEECASSKYRTLVLVDDFKNVYEASYMRARYSSFYLMSVSTDEEARHKNFNNDEARFQVATLNETTSEGRRKHRYYCELLKNEMGIDIEDIDASSKEYIDVIETDSFLEKCKAKGLTKYETAFCMQAFKDKLRRYAYLNSLHSFVLQDIVPCVENSDIFITNYYHHDYKPEEYPKDWNKCLLASDLMRYITLILHPGLLNPTETERCMQIAMTAKLNAGCLSRQVGAVITNEKFDVISLGWNDSPCGTVSCLRRNFFDLQMKFDPAAYSDYELSNPEFRTYVESINHLGKEKLNGLPGAFCFKDIYGKVSPPREQIHTRALHAEERALAACGEKARDGYLFTTSSPCELCAKRAKEAGIKRIYYIEQFTGISEKHVIQAGENRAEYRFFTGAVGAAYTKLYTALIPYKDELEARGFEPNVKQQVKGKSHNE